MNTEEPDERSKKISDCLGAIQMIHTSLFVNIIGESDKVKKNQHLKDATLQWLVTLYRLAELQNLDISDITKKFNELKKQTPKE
jgi:hypothetical protein